LLVGRERQGERKRERERRERERRGERTLLHCSPSRSPLPSLHLSPTNITTRRLLVPRSTMALSARTAVS